MSAAPLRVFRFGPFTLNEAQGNLLRGTEDLKLRPQSLQVLTALLERAGHVVSKDDLMERVWGDVVVTDHSLVRCIHDIRQALDDAAMTIVRTVPRRGYLFDTPVRVATVEGPPLVAPEGRPRPTRHLLAWIAGGGAATLLAVSALFLPLRSPPAMAGVPYVAVMPFESLGDGERYSYISDGFVDDIITNLSRFPEIAVLARNSTFLYRDADSPDLGHLGVRYQLSGSLRYEPGRLHINVHLLDVDLERVIWSQTYDRPAQEIFSIQDDIVSEVASRLAVSVRAAEASRISRVPEARLAAYELVLLAREVSFRAASFTSTMDARRLAERAISTDPDYADAHVELGRTYYRAYVLEWEGAEALARAQEAAHRAIALDQNSAAAIELLGRVELRLGRVEEALKTLTRALEPNPNRAETYASLADALTFAGRPDEALAMLGKATTLDPLYPPRIEMYLGRAHYFARSYKEARAALETCVARAPQFRPCYMYLVPTLAELGDDVAASSAIAKLLELSPDFSISASVLKHLPYREDPMRHYVSGLEKAGLPL